MHDLVNYCSYLNYIVLGPHDSWYIENILAITLTFCYIMFVKWFITTIINTTFGISKFYADWLAYTMVVVLTPITLSYYFNYELTGLSIAVFVIYSIGFFLKKIFKATLLTA